MGATRLALATLATALVLAVPANAAEWQTQDLEPGSGPADVAIDAGGNAVAVWTAEPTGSPVRVSFRRAGGRFEPPRTLDGCGGVYPGVDVDAQGRFTVLWVRCNGTVQAASGTDGNFDSTVTVAPAPPGDQWRAYPDLDVAPSGAAVAAWQKTTKDDSGDYKTGAEAALRAPGGSWDAPETISAGPLASWTLSMSDNIDAGIDSDGDAVVLFRRWRLDDEPWGNPAQMLGSEPNYKIDQVVVGRAGEGFEEPQTVGDRELQSVRLAVGSGGETLITWIVHDPPQAIGAIAGTTADPLAGEPYEAFRSADQDNDDPMPHIDGAGRAYIVFGRNGTAVIEAPDVGGPWRAPQAVSSAEWSPSFHSAVSEAGEVVVATYTDEAATAHVRLAGAGDFVHSATYDGSPALATAVNAGRAVALWVQPGRFAALYDEFATPPPAAPATDTRAPRCDVDNFRYRVRRVFAFVAECDEAADLSATLAMRRTRLATVARSVRANRARTVRMRAPRKGRRALARASARRRKVVVKLSLTATDAAGNSRVLRRKTAILAGE